MAVTDSQNSRNVLANRDKKRAKDLLKVLIFALAALSIVAASGIYYYKQSRDLRRELENTYMRAFHDMADYLNDIDVGLKKTMLSGDGAQMSTLSSQLYMQAEAAKACLAQMPTKNATFDNTSKFLSQVGDYAMYLTRKTIGNQAVTDEEFQNLDKLSQYAEAVNQEFRSMENRAYENNMEVESLSGASPFVVHADENTFQNGMQQIESMPQEYPSLIYDGPFSEHLKTSEPRMLKDKANVSRLSAERSAKAFLGDARAKNIAFESNGDGDIKTYLFTGTSETETISMEVTQLGGEVLWMLSDRAVKEERLSVEQAMKAGETFLSQKGYSSMKSSYYDVTDHIATVNYAYVQDGVVMYPDLIKVKIALDNGDIVGFEAQGFLMCHTNREIPNALVSEQMAREKAGKHLSVDSVSKVYIPLDSKREVYCYELKGTLGKNNFLIYINAVTGMEEKILMLQETERGLLTI